jgi:AMMECR1 domain-containing protein
MVLNCEEQDLAFSIIKSSIEHGFIFDGHRMFNPALLSDKFKTPVHVFVSLKHKDSLVGCQGNFGNPLPLFEALGRSAFNAGFRDARFPPINQNVLPKLSIEIHLLSPAVSGSVIFDINEFCSRLDTDDCVFLRSHDKEAFFLSSVQKSFSSKLLFMQALKDKAGIDSKTPWYFLNTMTAKTLSVYSQPYRSITP